MFVRGRGAAALEIGGPWRDAQESDYNFVGAP